MGNDNSQKPFKPSSYELVRLVLVPPKHRPLPLEDIFTELEIKEGIGRKTMRGHIKFLDSADIMNKMEITGLEKIEATWKSLATGDPEIEISLQVFRSSFVPSPDGTKKVVQLDLCSPEHYLQAVKTVDAAYIETTPSEDVEKIFNNTIGKLGKSIEVHETHNPHTKIIPGMTVLEAMEYLTRVSHSASFKTSLYRFYETRDGFYFHNVEKLINERRGEAIDFQYGANASDCPQDEKAQTFITNINFNQTKDMMTMLKSGNLSNEVKQISILDKTYDKYPWTLDDSWKETEHLDDSSISIHTKYFANEYINPRDVDAPITYTIYDTADFNDGGPQLEEAYVSRRLGYVLSLQQMSATMGVHGNTKLKIGDCVNLEIPATTPFEGRDDEPFVNGVWCITGLTHRIDDKNYVVEAQIIKDSYNDNAPEGNTWGRQRVRRKSNKQKEKGSGP